MAITVLNFDYSMTFHESFTPSQYTKALNSALRLNCPRNFGRFHTFTNEKLNYDTMSIRGMRVSLWDCKLTGRFSFAWQRQLTCLEAAVHSGQFNKISTKSLVYWLSFYQIVFNLILFNIDAHKASSIFRSSGQHILMKPFNSIFL